MRNREKCPGKCPCAAREQSDKSLTFAPSRPGKPARRKRSSFPIKTHADQTTHSRQSNAGSLRLPTVRAPGYGYVPQKFPHRYRTDQRLVRPSGFAAGCDRPQGGKPAGSPPCQALCLAAGAHPQPEICREPFLGLADGKPRLRPRLPEVRLVVGRPQRIRGKPAGRHRSHSAVRTLHELGRHLLRRHKAFLVFVFREIIAPDDALSSFTKTATWTGRPTSR